MEELKFTCMKWDYIDNGAEQLCYDINQTPTSKTTNAPLNDQTTSSETDDNHEVTGEKIKGNFGDYLGILLEKWQEQRQTISSPGTRRCRIHLKL